MDSIETDTVLQVFSLVRDRDERVADLYTPDATLTERGTVHSGRDAIRRFYKGVFSNGGVQPVVRGMWRSGTSYAVLIEATSGDNRVVHAMDVFEMSAGGICSLRIYHGGLTTGRGEFPPTE